MLNASFPELIEMMADADLMAARRVLGWAPKTSFRELVQMMVDADLKTLFRST